MKPLKYLLSLFALMVGILCCSRSSTRESLVIIQDYRNVEQPAVELESH